jgi:hypothetical protein
VKVCYLLCPIKKFIPNPLRCSNCLKDTHHKDACRSKPSSRTFGHAQEANHICDKTPYCINCAAPHSPSCPSWLRERKVREIQVTQELSLQEARVRYVALHMAAPRDPPAPNLPTFTPTSFPPLLSTALVKPRVPRSSPIPLTPARPPTPPKPIPINITN